MPVAGAERLYLSSRYGTRMDGQPNVDDSTSYPMFRLMQEAVHGQADLIAVSYSARTDLTYESDAEMEKAQQQFVSGRMFQTFRLNSGFGTRDVGLGIGSSGFGTRRRSRSSV